MLVVIHGVAPPFVVGIVEIYVGIEIDHARILLVPTIFTPHVDVILPHLGPLPEIGFLLVGVVVQSGGFNKEAVGEHLHVVLETADAGLGVVGTAVALDNLALRGAHRPAEREFGRTVFGIVVEVSGAEGILVLVVDLNHLAAESGQVVVGVINHVVAGHHRLVLDKLDVAVGLDLVQADIPDGGVAKHVGAIVEKGRRAADLAVFPLAGTLEDPGILCTE